MDCLIPFLIYFYRNYGTSASLKEEAKSLPIALSTAKGDLRPQVMMQGGERT